MESAFITGRPQAVIWVHSASYIAKVLHIGILVSSDVEKFWKKIKLHFRNNMAAEKKLGCMAQDLRQVRTLPQNLP